MRRHRGVAGVTSGLIAIALAAAGCGSGAGSEGDTITFAGLNTLTGPSAEPGQNTQRGAEIAVALANAGSGFKDSCGNSYKIKITSHDIGTTGASAISALRGTASDRKVLSVIGPTASTGLLPMVSVASGLKMPIIGMGTAPIPEWNAYVYRTSTPRPVADTIALTKLAEKLSLKKVAVIYDQAQDSEAAGEKLVESLASKLGYSVVSAEAFRTGDQNFTTQLQKIQATDPDLIALFSSPGDMGRIALQVNRMKMNKPLFASAGNFLDPKIWDTSNGAIKDGYTWTTFDFNNLTAGGQAFVDEFKKKFNVIPTLQSIWGNDAIAIALDAVKRSCSATDRGKFIKELGNTNDFDGGLGGNLTYQNPPTGDNQTPHVDVVQVTGKAQYNRMD